MSSFVVIADDTTAWPIDYLEDLVVGMSHTLTKFDELAVTGSNLSAYDLILVAPLVDVDTSVMAGYLEGYMTSDSIPILFLRDPYTLADDNYVTTSSAVATLLGVVATIYQNRYVGGVDEAGYGLNVPVTQFENHEVSMTLAAHLNAMGQGFLQPSLQGDFEGEAFAWGFEVAGTGDVAVAAPGDGQVAGTPLVRLQSSFWGTFREVACSVIGAGDARVGQGSGTFPVNCAWMGVGSGGYLIGTTGVMLQMMIRWCLGEYDSLTTYNTAAKSSVIRYPSIALDEGLNGTTYGSSSIDWTEVTPANTSVTVEASLDGENWTTLSNGGPVPGMSPADPIANVRLYLRVELATSNGVSTPQFSGFSYTLRAEQFALTDTPASYFVEGHLLWTGGDNTGQSMEVKSFDSAALEMVLFLKMRDAIAVGDTFTVLPGCNKHKDTCIAKFGNMLNFQGEPDIPGEDQILKTADVKR